MNVVPLLRRRWPTLTWWTVVVTAVVALVASAVFADGYPVRHVDLNDGGIWVTSDTDGLFGRLNKPAGALDAAFYPPGGAQTAYQLDIVQDGAAVAAWDQASGKLLPVDVQRAVTLANQAVAVPAGDQVRMGGGTVAVLDPASGGVWAARVDPGTGITSLYGLAAPAKPLATVGRSAPSGAAVTVGADGTVYAVAATGRTATIRPVGGGFARTEYGDLGRPLRTVQVTVVGDRLVVFDASSGLLVVPGGIARSLDTADPHAVLQIPGPDAPAVLLATSKVLLSVDLGTGDPTALWSDGQGAPAAPARLDGCVHAAWAHTTDGYVRSCGGPARPGNLTDAGALVHPEFRINRGAIVLNDLATGAVWDLAADRRVDDWDSVRPPPVTKPSKDDKNNNPSDAARDLPPKAVDDTLGARPGRTTILHVLDNDSDPSGKILSIRSVDQPDSPKAHTAISPDGQTIAVTVPAQSPELHFKYVIDDGTHTSPAAEVTVPIRTPAENRVPNIRAGAMQPTYTVPAGGQLSLPVLSDWRDFDGDPVVLVGASAKAGTAAATDDGYVTFTAPAKGGPVTVGYQVSDGVGALVGAAVSVTVQGPQSTTAVPATTEPDVAHGEVGHPILVRPLDNDLPGSDPTDPAAVVRLAADVPSPSGTTVTSDLHTGAVSVTATHSGTYLLDYSAAFGNAPFAKNQIRVDVVPDPATPALPVAMPDTAILHGQVPTTVDVLDNDYDPAGGVLVVQRAVPASADAPISVAIIAGHWLRISALSPLMTPNPQIVHYTITDGVTGPVTGEVSVTQIADATDNQPVPVDDYATVRAGDAVTVPVLDNDTDISGAPLSLVSDVTGAPAPGQLTVTATSGGTDDAGTAYVDGNFVRYLPPTGVTTVRQVLVDYVVQDPAGDQARGQLHVTVQPAPTRADPNRAPQPRDVTARVVAGDTAVIPIPATGIDPDGDSVAVTGLASGPTLGRILGMNATSLTYQAYPDSAGTDTFRYAVTDRYGGSATATVQVGVVPPGDPQPPVAVDDTVTAAPGAHLAVDIVANDLFAPDDAVAVDPLAALNPHLPAGTRLAASAGPLDLAAPDGSGKPLIVAYSVTDGIGQPSTATVTVRSQKGYDDPPVTRDLDALRTGTAATASVNVLRSSTDPDGAAGDLTVGAVYGAGVRVSSDGILTAPVAGLPYEVAYQVRDPGGATAVGVVHVPGSGAGGPYPKPDQLISVPRNGTRTVPVADYVLDPTGKPIRLTTAEEIGASPSTGLAVRAQGTSALVLTGRGGYVGPGAITFQVTDGRSLTDPAGRTAVITVPVQVGPDTPVMRCPADPLDVVEGGTPVTVNVTSVCHVWAADAETLAGLTYTATWKKAPVAVSLTGSGSHALTLTADSAAVPGSAGTVAVGIAGTQAAGATLSVRVLAAAPPSTTPITVDGVKAGQTAIVDLTSYVRSQLRRPIVSVVSVAQSSGQPATVRSSGSTVRITPGAATHGTMTFGVVVTDVAGAARTDRQATGQITLHVLGRPDPPGTPVVGRTVLSESVALSWATPPNNGAPITSYTVTYPGGQQSCPASPCLVTGLTNGHPYAFRVQAVNLVGTSDPSGQSASATPDQLPPAVTDITVTQPRDGSVQLSWTQPTSSGTAVGNYDVSWTGGGHASVPGTSMTASGLNNDTVYTFSITPVNHLGPGPTATADGESAGAPPTPQAPTFASANSTDHSTRAVTVSWTADDPNGPGPTTYTLERTGGSGSATICTAVTTTSCTDDGIGNDGTVYTYRMTAANADAATDPTAHTSSPGPGTTMTAATTPEPVTNVSAVPTGVDGQATLRFDAPRSNGASSTVTCTHNSATCGSWTFPTGGQAGVTETITGLPNGTDSTILLHDCNNSSGAGADSPCDGDVSTDVVTYGPMQNLTVSASASGTTVNWSASVDPNGKAASVTVQTSKGSTPYTTTVGAFSAGGSDAMGYSATDTITVTVSDPGRPTLTKTVTATTPAAPPPPVSITATEGAAGTSSIGTCTSTSQNCHWLNFQVHNFPLGSYKWSCWSTDTATNTTGDSYDSSVTVRITDPNQSFAPGNSNGECIWGAGFSEAIQINGVRSNSVPH